MAKTATQLEQVVRAVLAKYVAARRRRDKQASDVERRRLDTVTASAWKTLRAAIDDLR